MCCFYKIGQPYINLWINLTYFYKIYFYKIHVQIFAPKPPFRSLNPSTIPSALFQFPTLNSNNGPKSDDAAQGANLVWWMANWWLIFISPHFYGSSRASWMPLFVRSIFLLLFTHSTRRCEFLRFIVKQQKNLIKLSHYVFIIFSRFLL